MPESIRTPPAKKKLGTLYKTKNVRRIHSTDAFCLSVANRLAAQKTHVHRQFYSTGGTVIRTTSPKPIGGDALSVSPDRRLVENLG
jgi:hypothetical protein